MSGSSGNTSAGTKGGRSARAGNGDVVARHTDPAGRHGQGTDAETHARPSLTGGNDSRHADPDAKKSGKERRR